MKDHVQAIATEAQAETTAGDKEERSPTFVWRKRCLPTRLTMIRRLTRSLSLLSKRFLLKLVLLWLAWRLRVHNRRVLPRLHVKANSTTKGELRAENFRRFRGRRLAVRRCLRVMRSQA